MECRYCGEEFEPYDESNNGFCSESCKRKYRRRHPGEKDYYKICAHCGKPFGTNNKQDVYCSDDCRRDAQPWKYPYERECEYCGKRFMASRENARFCSSKCAACANGEASRKPESGRKPKKDFDTPKICKYCGKEFYMKRRGPITDFCSKDCADRYRRENEYPKMMRYYHKCEGCGKTFFSPVLHQRFCSAECVDKNAWREGFVKTFTCARCGKTYEADVPYRLTCPTCSNEVAKEKKETARRERRMMTGDWHDNMIRLDRVYIRDGGICGVCGLPVPMDAAPENIWSATRDHIIPLSKGGSHTYANCQLAHRICNSMKSDSLKPGFTVDWEEKLMEDPERWSGPLDDLREQLNLDPKDGVAAAL